MAKKEYAEESFGAYFVKLIKDHEYSQAKFASDLGVSKTYLFDVFKDACGFVYAKCECSNKYLYF